ncbi:hypothetical protein ScPMuIL_003645 [Solemya velum]
MAGNMNRELPPSCGKDAGAQPQGEYPFNEHWYGRIVFTGPDGRKDHDVKILQNIAPSDGHVSLVNGPVKLTTSGGRTQINLSHARSPTSGYYRLASTGHARYPTPLTGMQISVRYSISAGLSL